MFNFVLNTSEYKISDIRESSEETLFQHPPITAFLKQRQVHLPHIAWPKLEINIVPYTIRYNLN